MYSPHLPPLSLTGASLPPSPDRARAILIERGVLILDDDRSNLDAVASVCMDYLNIPQQRVALLHVRPGMSLAQIKQQTEGLLKTAIASTGACFGSLITDYNLSPTITSLEIWRAVESALSEAPYHEPWTRTARVLMTGATDESPIIKAETDRIIDTHILKPFKISHLESALITSILGRLR
jgi:hypothetical protein